METSEEVMRRSSNAQFIYSPRPLSKSVPVNHDDSGGFNGANKHRRPGGLDKEV
jgi:hypothetical protein